LCFYAFIEFFLLNTHAIFLNFAKFSILATQYMNFQILMDVNRALGYFEMWFGECDVEA